MDDYNKVMTITSVMMTITSMMMTITSMMMTITSIMMTNESIFVIVLPNLTLVANEVLVHILANGDSFTYF